MSAKKNYPVYKLHAKGTIHPRSVEGNFRRFKTSVMILAYATFFLLPWLRWQRPVGSQQAVHFDLVEKKFYLFDFVVHAQDIFWLAALLFFAAVFLFFMTALLGRVFCGYFCFQTLWTDAFRFIEKKFQGDRVARIRLDKQPWTREKLMKKGATHALWLLLAFWTGLTFVLYWADAPTVFVQFFSGNAHSAAYTTALILTITTYLAAGWVKENVCMHICPYARFQSVMYDVDTMITAYDYQR
ncbi:MAG TPA: 4Fe-4S binding protein, partial [Thiothrix sp.]|nr:4Fe-4S binding protein [Thiothrix sp.]